MKARVGTCLAVLLTVFALVPTFAQLETTTCLKDYEIPTTKLRAGFVPYKAEVVLGEPLRATFIVENLGPTNFEFWFGGDYRGTGRHDRFKIAITNSDGNPLPDPLTNLWFGGGISWPVRLKPGQSFSNVLDLTAFRVIDKPGAYTVSCSFAFDEQWREVKQTNPVVQTTFTLTLLKRTPERVTKVLDALVIKARAAQGQELRATLALLARFGGDEAIPRLAQLAKSGSIELRSAALRALPLVPTDASLDVVLPGFKDSEPAIRVAAAGSLGEMKQPRATDALLDAFPNEKSPVAEAILLALGATKSDRAFPVITNELEMGNIERQHAAVNALSNSGGSNAVAVLQRHINTNFLSLRYAIVLALAEKLHQPMQAEWLLPILAERDYNNGEWFDSLRLLRMYGGDKAIPTMLSCVDFDVAWSERNWWILEQGVKPCPHAPPCDYEYDPNSDGTPEQRQKNFQLLQTLKPLAGPIPASTPPAKIPSVPYLITDPPIDFTPTIKETEAGDVEIKSGFLTLTLSRGGANLPYCVSEVYRPVYDAAARFRSLPNMPSENRAKLNITPEQMRQLNELLRQFAVTLCGRRVSDQKLGNLYNSLVLQPDFLPGDDEWWHLLLAYKEAPAGPLQEQAKANLVEEVRIFSQNYHAGTVEFAEAAKNIFTPTQLDQIVK